MDRGLQVDYVSEADERLGDHKRLDVIARQELLEQSE